MPEWVNPSNVKVIFIYLREAHADNSWPIGTPKQYAVSTDHATIDERCSIAKEITTVLPPLASIPIYADDMNDKFTKTYGAWPTQFFLFNQKQLIYRAPNPERDAHFNFPEFVESVMTITEMKSDP